MDSPLRQFVALGVALVLFALLVTTAATISIAIQAVLIIGILASLTQAVNKKSKGVLLNPAPSTRPEWLDPSTNAGAIVSRLDKLDGDIQQLKQKH